MNRDYSVTPVLRFWQHTGQPYSYLIPALAVFLFVVFSPVIMSLILSFYSFTGFDANIFKEFAGFQNFQILFNDKYFWISFKNTFLFVLASITIQIAFAMII